MGETKAYEEIKNINPAVTYEKAVEIDEVIQRCAGIWHDSTPAERECLDFCLDVFIEASCNKYSNADIEAERAYWLQQTGRDGLNANQHPQ